MKTNSKASFPAVDRSVYTVHCGQYENENDAYKNVNLQLIRQIDSVFSVHDDVRQGERELQNSLPDLDSIPRIFLDILFNTKQQERGL